ncbi:hypothetical protein RR48_00971 [Papilio machaon]|uniref:Uncharacterized protein n=1 Tax=Papilio machaon TaxID=76193 RepID=A0A0N1IC54_PAPMA|nr:hypothetical protein RR48_00971 [Papilio machaon]
MAEAELRAVFNALENHFPDAFRAAKIAAQNISRPASRSSNASMSGSEATSSYDSEMEVSASSPSDSNDGFTTVKNKKKRKKRPSSTASTSSSPVPLKAPKHIPLTEAGLTQPSATPIPSLMAIPVAPCTDVPVPSPQRPPLHL